MNEKKVGPKPARIQKPGTGSEQRSQSKAIQTLKRKAKASGRMADLLRLVDATN